MVKKTSTNLNFSTGSKLTLLLQKSEIKLGCRTVTNENLRHEQTRAASHCLEVQTQTPTLPGTGIPRWKSCLSCAAVAGEAQPSPAPLRDEAAVVSRPLLPSRGCSCSTNQSRAPGSAPLTPPRLWLVCKPLTKTTVKSLPEVLHHCTALKQSLGNQEHLGTSLQGKKQFSSQIWPSFQQPRKTRNQQY